MAYRPRVHIRNERFTTLSLCGQPWRGAPAAGRPCSDSDPPYVTNDESGSTQQASCLRCVQLYREKMLGQKKQNPG